MQKGVIYKVQNLENGKVYVGCTLNFGKRIASHLSCAFAGKTDRAFYAELKDYPERFSFQMLEFNVPISDLKIRESHWISLCDSAVTGYNQCVYAANEDLSESDVKEIKMMLSDDVIKFSDIAKLFNVSESAVSDINRGKSWFCDKTSYPLRRNTVKRKKLDIDTLVLIHELLKEPSISFREIANRFGWESEAVVRKINAGTYSVRLYKPEEYPIRSVDSRKGRKS